MTRDGGGLEGASAVIFTKGARLSPRSRCHRGTKENCLPRRGLPISAADLPQMTEAESSGIPEKPVALTLSNGTPINIHDISMTSRRENGKGQCTNKRNPYPVPRQNIDIRIQGPEWVRRTNQERK